MNQTNCNPNWISERTKRMDEMTFCGVPEDVGDMCYKCQQPMKDGEPVHMSWTGEAISHIRCELSTSGQERVA